MGKAVSSTLWAIGLIFKVVWTVALVALPILKYGGHIPWPWWVVLVPWIFLIVVAIAAIAFLEHNNWGK